MKKPKAPVLFLVSDQRSLLEALDRDLRRRFGSEYQIIAAPSPIQGLATLRKLASGTEPVVLMIADDTMNGMTGVEFLVEAHALHPSAKRVLLVERDLSATNPVVPAMTLGQVDYHLVKPWFPEKGLYPAVSSFLSAWAASNESDQVFFRIVGSELCARSHEIRDYLTRLTLPYRFLAADSEEGRGLLRDVGQNGSQLPIVLRRDGKLLIAPSNSELVEAFGVASQVDSSLHDLVIVGAGPAGLAAAVNAASEGLDTMIVERSVSGGQAGTSSHIRNFLGFTWGIGGHELAYRACEQAWLFGAKMVFTQEAAALSSSGTAHVVRMADGREVAGRAVIIASGMKWRRLGVDRLERLIGTGVFYGAAASEARAMSGRHVCVVGGGNSAGQAALHLAQYAASVTMLIRGDSVARSMSDYLIREIENTPNIAVRFRCEVVDGQGDGRLEEITIRDRSTSTTERLQASGAFVLIGGEPVTGWLAGSVALDRGGFVLTGADLMQEGRLADDWPLRRPPFLLETSVPGVFAAGDVRYRSVKRVASAVGEGAAAVQFVHQYLAEQAGPRALSRLEQPGPAKRAASGRV